MAKRLAGTGSEAVGVPGWRERPKGRQRASDKIVKYEGDVSRLRDLAAAKIEFWSLDRLYEVLDSVMRDPDVRILLCDDRFQQPQASGYRDIQLLLEMSNGHVAEFRLHLAALDEVAAWEHALYEVARDLDAVARNEVRSLSTTEHALLDGILRKQQQLFWEALCSTYEKGDQ